MGCGILGASKVSPGVEHGALQCHDVEFGSDVPKQLPVAEDFAGAVVSIEPRAWKVEERAIVLEQLNDLMSVIKLRLDQETLMSTGPRPTRLSYHSCNLYDTMEHFIKPATEEKQCSYVELVASGPQLAQWFVSHWWGEPVVQFTACVEKHSHHRKLSPTVAYWVCAYANNQWQLDDDLGGGNPATSSFHRALEVSIGTLSILDESAKVYSRIWCDYEVYVTLDKATRTSHLYDIYTWTRGSSKKRPGEIFGEAIGLTDGVAAIDQRGASWWWEDKKQHREKSFPFELAEAAMKIQVQRGEASVELDRRRILHAICGTDGEEPPSEHPNYEAVNATLHARFALTTWSLALRHGRDVEGYARALAISHLTRISFCFRSEKWCNDAMLTTLAKALPMTLKELSLVMTRCKISDEGIMALGMAIARLDLENLHLDLAHSRITDASMKAFCPQLPRSLRHLWFSIGMCKQLTDFSVQCLADALTPGLEELFLSLVHCPGLTGKSLQFLGSAVNALSMRSFSLLLGNVIALEDAGLIELLEKLPQALEEFFLDCWACERLSLEVLHALRFVIPKLTKLKLLELTMGEIPEISGKNDRKYVDRQRSDLPEMLLEVQRTDLEIRFLT
eukprot:symbB.v1.2.017757.t1/scaffold1389.1/size122275/6